MSKLSLRQSILSAKLPATVVKNVFGGLDLTVTALTVRRRTLYLDAVYANEKENSAWKADQELPVSKRQGLPRVDLYDPAILLIMFGVVDENNDLVFDLADYNQLTDADYPDIVKVYTAIHNLQNRDPEDQKKSSD